jgi:uncharacterized metal-binding protein
MSQVCFDSVSKERIIIVPCSGIGKAFGTVAREATYAVVEDMRKDKATTLCLSLLVMGDKTSRDLVKTHPCIVIDGCPLECAKKNIEVSGGHVAASFRVIDVLKNHRDLKTSSVTFLDDNGRHLARILAEEVAKKVDELEEKTEE